ncbi:DUF2254 domain-containing protein [Janibacter sp. GS2]|uniref:DUF2254 domain-containing protein n=1 Tax=Janibacter sp. GS2 TaxID=3442646 RepID=UPI003EBC1A30
MTSSTSARSSIRALPSNPWWRRMWRPFWVLPLVICVLALVAGVVIPTLDEALVGSVPYVFQGGPDGARTLLSTIAGAMISVTGLVFSVTIVVLQLASSQFTPRIIPEFLSSRVTQGTLGFFMATFIFALTVMRAVRGGNEDLVTFVPDVSVTLAFVLVLVSVGYFLAFIHTITSSIQVSRIVSRLGKSTLALAERVYPDATTATDQDGGGDQAADPAHATWSPRPGTTRTDVVAADRHGLVTSIDYPTLVRTARDADVVVVVEIAFGEFVAAGQQLATVWGTRDLDEAARRTIGRAIRLGEERSMVQDVAFGFRQLVDIAERALSPGINDPTTAAQTLDELHRVLRVVAVRDSPSSYVTDPDGDIRVIHQLPTFGVLLDLAVDEISHYGRDSIQIPRRLVTMLDDLRSCARPRWAGAIDAASQRVARRSGVEDAREV